MDCEEELATARVNVDYSFTATWSLRFSNSLEATAPVVWQDGEVDRRFQAASSLFESLRVL